MEKVLFQEIADLEQRKQVLLDNADEVVEMDYHKTYDSDQLAKKKDELAEKSIKIQELEEQFKDFKQQIKEELKPLKAEAKDLINDLKAKGHLVKEKCYKMVDQEEKIVAFYNAEGVLVSSRPATKAEMQTTIFAEIRNAQ